MGLGRKEKVEGFVSIEQRIAAPAQKVGPYIGDFRNARDWMVGIESVERLGENTYRLKIDTPVGKLEPGVNVTEHGDHSIRWVYTSHVEGGGSVEVSPDTLDGHANGSVEGCVVSYAGEFKLKRKLLDRAARAVGMERFSRRNGERSLLRLKQLMEARRY